MEIFPQEISTDYGEGAAKPFPRKNYFHEKSTSIPNLVAILAI
jgi:hypothetical protein